MHKSANVGSSGSDGLGLPPGQEIPGQVNDLGSIRQSYEMDFLEWTGINCRIESDSNGAALIANIHRTFEK